MGWNEKGLIKKLKTGFIGLSLIGASYFNANAQENYIPKYNTIAHKMLMIEDSADNIPLNTYPTIKTLDNLIDNSKNYIDKKESYTKKEISEIADKIYLDFMEKMPEIKKREETDFCYRTSLIYLAIGQANEIPFYLSILPSDIKGHGFIRYDPDGKHDPSNPDNPINKGDINIETTEGLTEVTSELAEENKIYSDEFYMKNYYLKKESLENNNYLRNLNEKELLGIAYMFKAKPLYKKGEYEKAIKNYKIAIELNPKEVKTYFFIGMAFRKIEEHEKALENFNKSLELYESPEIYSQIGFCYANLKQYEKSIQEYTNAINLIEDWKKNFLNQKAALDGYKSNYLAYRAHYYKKLGNEEKANQDYENLKDIISKYSPYSNISVNKLDSVITSIYKIKEE